MKTEKHNLSFEVSVKRSSEKDAIPQTMIERCIRIAMDALEGKRDRDGNALILHSLMVGSMGKTDAEKCVGFLHDVVEDSEYTLERLREEGVCEEVLTALDLCTHPEGMEYYEYVQRIIDSGNVTAIHVKRNDLMHNLARGRAYGYADLVKKHGKALKMVEESNE